jgi:arylsulfatase A-like enzyme
MNCPRSILTIVGSLVCLIVGCGSPDDEGARAPRGDRAQGAVVFILDTIRADHVSSYGHDRLTTPAIDVLAEKGVRFEQAVSYAPWTAPSVASILTGAYPAQVFREGKIAWSLAESFSAAGFSTAAVTEGGYVSRYFGMDRGFDYYHEEETDVPLMVEGRPFNALPTGTTEKTFRLAREWLDDHADEPFFLVVHTYEAHTPYRSRDFVEGVDAGRLGSELRIEQVNAIREGQLVLTEEEKEYGRALYDGDVRNADRYVGEFMDFLEEKQIADSTVIVVVSDHGEELGDHYERHIFSHGHSLHDDLIRVPLVIYDPTQSGLPKTMPAQVPLLDVLPTVADLLGVQIERPVEGRSLMPLLTGEEQGNRIVMLGDTRWGSLRMGVRDGRYKYIAIVMQQGPPLESLPVPPVQLYDLEQDPGEQINIADAHPQLVRMYSEVLQSWIARMDRPPAETEWDVSDDALLDRLRSLGYVDD